MVASPNPINPLAVNFATYMQNIEDLENVRKIRIHPPLYRALHQEARGNMGISLYITRNLRATMSNELMYITDGGKDIPIVNDHTISHIEIEREKPKEVKLTPLLSTPLSDAIRRKVINHGTKSGGRTPKVLLLSPFAYLVLKAEMLTTAGRMEDVGMRLSKITEFEGMKIQQLDEAEFEPQITILFGREYE